MAGKMSYFVVISATLRLIDLLILAAGRNLLPLSGSAILQQENVKSLCKIAHQLVSYITLHQSLRLGPLLYSFDSLLYFKPLG